jgi:hypothetical protein
MPTIIRVHIALSQLATPHRQSTALIIMEYSCTKDNKLWRQDDRTIGCLAIDELEKTGLATINDVPELSVRCSGPAIPAYTPA